MASRACLAIELIAVGTDIGHLMSNDQMALGIDGCLHDTGGDNVGSSTQPTLTSHPPQLIQARRIASNAG
jgi:hypothetical protein